MLYRGNSAKSGGTKLKEEKYGGCRVPDPTLGISRNPYIRLTASHHPEPVGTEH